jgi:hypothetical protein
MGKATHKSAAFLQALRSAPPTETPAPANTSEPRAPKLARTASRTGLKHIGGYFDRADVEKIAVLRARLGLDNSQLIKLAIDELYRNHEAKRAFGDA